MAKSSKVENVQETQAQTVPDILSPEWSDYVLTQFAPEELVDGHPTVAGLRRLAEKFIGEIISSKPTQVWPVEGDGLGRATVVYEVVFGPKLNMLGGSLKTFTDVADVWAGNTDDSFVAYAVAVAATRAEARALRKALKLRAVAIEELAKSVTKVTESSSNEDLISDQQIHFLNSRCQQLNIDLVKFINAGEKTYRSVNQILKSTASRMIKEVNSLMNNPSLIPADLLGYREDWQSSFGK